MRRTRLSADVTEGLQPLQAVRLYLESRGVEPQRREQILKRAEELVEQELEGLGTDDQSQTLSESV
jgi:hypothetical protein